MLRQSLQESLQDYLIYCIFSVREICRKHKSDHRVMSQSPDCICKEKTIFVTNSKKFREFGIKSNCLIL